MDLKWWEILLIAIGGVIFLGIIIYIFIRRRRSSQGKVQRASPAKKVTLSNGTEVYTFWGNLEGLEKLSDRNQNNLIARLSVQKQISDLHTVHIRRGKDAHGWGKSGTTLTGDQKIIIYNDPYLKAQYMAGKSGITYEQDIGGYKNTE